jgi:hypothetical protein
VLKNGLVPTKRGLALIIATHSCSQNEIAMNPGWKCFVTLTTERRTRERAY